MKLKKTRREKRREGKRREDEINFGIRNVVGFGLAVQEAVPLALVEVFFRCGEEVFEQFVLLLEIPEHYFDILVLNLISLLLATSPEPGLRDGGCYD